MSGFFARRSHRGRMLALGAGAILATALVAVGVPAAQATTGQPNNVSPEVSSLRAEVRNGTLLATHGVLNVCAAHNGRCTAEVVTTSVGSQQALSSSTPLGYGPADLAAAYHLPASNLGAAGTVAVIEAAPYPTLEADLATYRAQFGLPACTSASGCLRITDYHGGPPLAVDPTGNGPIEEEFSAEETALDVDMISASCPQCKILEVQVPTVDGFPQTQADVDAATTDFGTAVNTAVSLGTNAISMSYQYPSDTAMDTGPISQALFHPGVALLASSGDGGFEGNQHGGWPQNLPWVTSVGGTSLYTTNAAGTKFTETAWSGAGSSCETDLPAAIGQPRSVAAACAGHRASSDVSAVADPATGVAVYDTYSPFFGQPLQWAVFGGTSVSSPFVAGLYVRGGHLSQVIGPNTIYAAPKKDFTDVTLGQNAPPHGCQSIPAPLQLCQSGKGWDGPTGVGTPNGLAAF